MLKKCILLTFISGLLLASFVINTAQATEHSKKKPNAKHHLVHKAKATNLDMAIPKNVSPEDGIAQIVNRFNGQDKVGIIIKSLDSDQIIYQHNATEKFNPASTLKLFTAVAALDYLGPDFTFSTQLLTDTPANPINGVLAGNLYIKFSGDPYLTTEALKKMIHALTAQGIHNIQGNIIIDDNALDRSPWPTGRIPTDKTFCYAAPVTATIIDRNCFSFNVGPSRKSTLAAVSVNNLGNILISNQISMKHSKGQSCGLDLKPVDEADNSYVLKGCLSSRSQPMAIAVALLNPNLATSSILAHLFKNAGISYQKIIYDKTQPNTRILVENTSPTLDVLLNRMLKKSDNLIADSLFKKLGAIYFSGQGSWLTGSQAVQAILAKTNIDFQNAIILDGSGLSRENAVTPNDFIKLLTFAHTKMPNNDLFYEALPRSGLDGTLKHRLGGAALNRIHAKTGTMHGISGLAGYIRTANNKPLAFAILINENTPINKQWSYHLLEDRICQFLAQSSISS